MGSGKNIEVLKLNEVVVDYRSRSWCKLPYPNHPHGCPNYGKKKTCPPKAPFFEKIVKPPFTLVGIKFNLEKHVKKMKEKHSGWSDRQAKCLLYWQKKVDKQLIDACKKIASTIPNSRIVYVPEATGVNVFETCRKHGLILERNPKKNVWKIAIIGIKK